MTSSLFSMDPYVNLKLSNQKATSTVQLKGGNSLNSTKHLAL